jgi:ABC-type lipoprotein release transport system permease subunit
MSILKLALRNVARHGRRSLTIALLIAAGTALFVVGNAVFANAVRGIKASFIDSFTGDFSVSAKADEVFSLFGNEVPIVGEYATPLPLQSHDSIASAMRALPGVKSVVSVVSGAARLDSNGWHDSAIFFGVAGPEYTKAFPSISVISGEFLAEGKPGLLLNAAQAEEYEKKTGKGIAVGDKVSLTMYSDAGFTIRSIPIAGTFAYATRSEASDRICLVDVETARSLNGYIVGSIDREADSSPIVADSIDELFSSGMSDSESALGGPLELSSVEKALEDTSARKEAARTLSGAWNFIIVRAEEGWSLSRLRGAIERALDSGGYEARVLDWRGTAGSQAQMVYVLRLVFNVGIVILAVAGLVIIMNSLVISVLERAGEIGMMRAIGASRSYVCRLFVAETTAITFVGALAGLAVGCVGVLVLSLAGIRLTNPLLITLFSGSVIRPSIGLLDALAYLAVAMAAGALAWIYPVRLVLRSQPIQAMAKAEQ